MSDIMKNSGYQWIGKIPNDWKISRILPLLKMPITDGPHTTPEMYDEGIPFVSAEAVSTGNGRINFNNIWGYISEEFYKECCRKYKPEINDIYMIKSGATTGRVSILEEDIVFNIWSPLAVFRTNDNKMLSKFMFYSLQANFFQMQVQLGWTYGTQQNISMRTLEHLKICVPPIGEQILIVNYLDDECGKLDEIIADLQNQINKLEDYKKSLIHECVTKGIYKNVELADSGIDWIGYIPKHWNIKKIKYCTSYIGSGSTPNSDNLDYYENGTINWIQSGDLYRKDNIYESEVKISLNAIRDISALNVLKAPYIIVAMYGASVGNVAISRIDACSNQACCSIKTDNENDLDYMYYWILKSKEVLTSKSVGGGQPNISQQILKNHLYLVPPKKEQQEISKYLKIRIKTIDEIIQNKSAQLEHMKQYKSSLINEYVTGKKRVKVGE